MKTDIVLIGFFKDLTKKIGEKLALDFGLYYADVEDMLEYHLMNEQEIEKLCGIKYLNGLKQKVVKDLSSYENSLITIPYSIFSSNKNYEMFKSNFTIVFLNFEKIYLEQKINQLKDEKERAEGKAFLLACEERAKFCKDNSDITIDISKPVLELCYKKVKRCLSDYFL